MLEQHGQLDREISSVEFDSRAVQADSLFVAVGGTRVDGHDYLPAAEERGASALLVERMPAERKDGLTYLRVENSQAVLGRAIANFYDNPAEELVVVGVTGTNGKTTVATLLHQLFTQMGVKAGLVSTIRYQIGEEELPSTHTTPDPKQLHQLFRQMVEAGCEVCFMEVSSHALTQHRTAGIPFKAGLFTNLTHDHLDYHGTFKAYLQAKKLLFDGLGKRSVAIVNLDDRNGKVIVQNTQAKVATYSLRSMADYRARILENTFDGLLLEIDGEQVWFRLRGSFNAYNLLVAYATAVELGYEDKEVLQALSTVSGAEGRFQIVDSPGEQKTGIVDYAHTPDALKNVLQTVRDVSQGQNRVITVVGCGGNRDRAKRPEMARIATELSEKVILTSDNPRDEDPEAILDEMMTGVTPESQARVLRITARREAIRTAVALSQPGDVILVAGKGHETYQEIKGTRHPFDDREILREAMNT